MMTTIEKLPLDAFHPECLGDTATVADAAAWARVFAAWLADRHPALTLAGFEIIGPIDYSAPEEGVWAQFEAVVGDDWWEAVEWMQDRGELLPRMRKAGLLS